MFGEMHGNGGVAPEESSQAGITKIGAMSKTIERYTSQPRAGTFLSLALGSIALSAILQAVGRKQDAQFVGQWVPTILIIGLYNKLVKLQSSD